MTLVVLLGTALLLQLLVLFQLVLYPVQVAVPTVFIETLQPLLPVVHELSLYWSLTALTL